MNQPAEAQLNVGYTCPQCGQFVVAGTWHQCAPASPFAPTPLGGQNALSFPWWQFMPVLERYVAAMEKLVTLTEQRIALDKEAIELNRIRTDIERRLSEPRPPTSGTGSDT